MLQAVQDVVTRALDAGEVSGAVVMVCHDGAMVHADARGTTGTASSRQAQGDTLFWLASVSEVVTAAAVLAVVAEGSLQLDDPVWCHVPEFDPPGLVWRYVPGSSIADPTPRWYLVPAQREITLRDLLTHTSGLLTTGLGHLDHYLPQAGDTLATHVPTLAKVIRDVEAGAGWARGDTATFDIVARMVEVAAGAGFDRIVQDRIVAPLGLLDLGFGLGTDLRAAPGDLHGVEVAAGGYHSGAAGLWGSMPALLRFAEMLRAGGRYRGRQILPPSLVAVMTTNQVGELCPGPPGRPDAPGIGFGLGVAVVTDASTAGTVVPTGSFGWDADTGCRFWCSTDGWSLAMHVPDVEVQQRVEAAVAHALA